MFVSEGGEKNGGGRGRENGEVVHLSDGERRRVGGHHIRNGWMERERERSGEVKEIKVWVGERWVEEERKERKESVVPDKWLSGGDYDPFASRLGGGGSCKCDWLLGVDLLPVG